MSRARAWLGGLLAGLAVAVAGPADAAPKPTAHPHAAARKPPAHKPPAHAPAKATAKAPPTRAKRRPAVHRDEQARVSIGGVGASAGAGTRGGAINDTWRREPESQLSLEERTAKRIEEVLRGPLRAGTTALYAVDATTGRELFAVHPDDPLNPASNVKLVSTATALDILGADFQYQTRLFGHAPATGGKVEGDVYLLGSYDPTLGKADLDELTATLAKRGVTSIAGDVVIGPEANRDAIFRANASLTLVAGAPGQAPTVTVDPHYDYVHVDVLATTSKRKRSALRFDEQVASDGHGHSYLSVKITGTVGRGRTESHAIWPRDRGLHTAYLLRAALTRAGVSISGDVHVAELADYAATAGKAGWLPVELATHASAPLAAIVSQVNKRSINWLADRVVMTAAAAKYATAPAMSGAVDAMYAWLGAHAGLARDAAVIDTGSGLSYRTELSARQVVTVLRAAAGCDPATETDDAARARHAAYVASLSVAGVDGTLRHRFMGELRGLLHGKTGTLARVIALSGLLEAAPGHPIAFSLITNGQSPDDKHQVRVAHEKIVAILGQYVRDLAAKEATAAPAAAAPPPSVTAPASAGDDLDDGESESDDPTP